MPSNTINREIEKVKAIVPVERRALLVLNCLAEHGDARFRWLYEYIELAGVGVARRFLKRHYRAIYALQDKEATRLEFLSLLQSLTADYHNEAVDLFFQVHGKPGRVRFFDQWVSTHMLGEYIRRTAVPNRLRLVYNLSCYGDSHSPGFLNAGFRVSVGARKINANAGTEYPVFCRAWHGKTFGRPDGSVVNYIMRRADRTLPRRIQDRIASRYFNDVDSEKLIRGDGNISIYSMP